MERLRGGVVDDCRTMAKLPRDFYPDFGAVDTSGGDRLIETKGQGDLKCDTQDRVAELWCKNGTEPGVGKCQYMKVRDEEFESSLPTCLEQLPKMDQQKLA